MRKHRVAVFYFAKKKSGKPSLAASGATNRIRTDDLILTKDVLYLLSHSSVLHYYSTLFYFVKRF